MNRPKAKRSFYIHMRLPLLLILIIIVSGPAVAQNAPNALSPMGINLSSVTYWSPELVFVDLFKRSQPWQSKLKGHSKKRGNDLVLTNKGELIGLHPDQRAESIIIREDGHYPAGNYLCLYEGGGEIEFKFDAVVKRRSPGRILLHVNPSDDGMLMAIKETYPEDPIRNIRIILPEFENSYQDHPFHPDFLKRWVRFKVIRFMDWMETNNSGIVTWADRPVPDMQTQGGKRGVALEYMILLANILKADPWFCMPHKASYNYVHNFAMMVKKKLDPDLKIYVEYTNEAWNDQFDQSDYCRKMGRKMSLSSDPVKAKLFFYAKRSMDIFKIWGSVFGGSKRLVRVLGSQYDNPWISRQILNYENAWQQADALAVAPYFGQKLGSPKQKERVLGMSVENILDFCLEDIRQNHQKLSAHQSEAGPHGLDLIAYEGGQHLSGRHGVENDKIVTYLFNEANRHPRMKDLYQYDLSEWKRAGGKLFVAFASMSRYSKWGSWGLLEHMDQNHETAPKFQGVIEFIENNPVWWR